MRWREGNPVRQITTRATAICSNPRADYEEEKKYFKAASDVVDRNGRRNLYDVGTIMLNQGMSRPEEIMSARKCDLDLSASTLAIPGGKSRAARRTLHLTPKV